MALDALPPFVLFLLETFLLLKAHAILHNPEINKSGQMGGLLEQIQISQHAESVQASGLEED